MHRSIKEEQEKAPNIDSTYFAVLLKAILQACFLQKLLLYAELLKLMLVLRDPAILPKQTFFPFQKWIWRRCIREALGRRGRHDGQGWGALPVTEQQCQLCIRSIRLRDLCQMSVSQIFSFKKLNRALLNSIFLCMAAFINSQ